MNTIVLYTNGGQESDRLKSLLSTMGGEFLEYNLGKDFSEAEFKKEFGSEAEYPQVAVGYRHIGGLKETLQYLQSEGHI